jgi:hypothetical protein
MANVTCGLCGGDFKECNTAGAFQAAMENAARPAGITIQHGDLLWRVGLAAWEAAVEHAMGGPPKEERDD